MRREHIEQPQRIGQNRNYDRVFGALRRATDALEEAEHHARRARLSTAERSDVNTACALVAADVERVRQERGDRAVRRAQDIVRRAQRDRRT